MKQAWLFVIIAVVLVGGALFLYFTYDKAQVPEAPASVSDPHPEWSAYTDDSLTFRYPPELGTTYVHPVEWPPDITVLNAFSCTAGRSEQGETIQTEIQGSTYCVTVQSEGAAGSIYTEHTYVTQKGDGGVSLSFTLRSTQCANYDEPQQGACFQERQSFSPDGLAAAIPASVEVR